MAPLAMILAGALAISPPVLAQPNADRTLQTAHGLLNRGLHEQAIPEYRAFLAANADHDGADGARYGLGVCHYRLGSYSDALEALGAISGGGEFPFAFEAALLRADCLLRLDQPGEAAKALRVLVTRAPDHASAPQAAGLLVEALSRAGQHREVVAAAERAASRWPDAPSADRTRLLRAMSLVELDRHSEAMVILGPLLGDGVDPAIGRPATLLLAQSADATGRGDTAAGFYERVVESGRPEDRPIALLALAKIDREKGRLDPARTRLRGLIERYPDHPTRLGATMELMLVEFEAGRHELARSHAERVIAGNDLSLHPTAAYWRAKSALRMNDHRSAAQELASALERFPQSPFRAEMTYDLGVALLRSGAAEEGAERLRGFRAANPNHELVPSALYAEAAAALEAGDHATARRLASRLTRSHPDHGTVVEAMFIEAEACYLAGDHRAAAASFARLLERPDAAEHADRATYRLGMSRFRQGDHDGAHTHLSAIAGADPLPSEMAPALAALGEIEFGRQEWAAAERALTRFLGATSPGDAREAAALRLALAISRQDRCAEAIDRFDGIIQRAPASPEAAHARFERAICLEELGRTEEAAEAFAAIARAPSSGASPFAPRAMRRLGDLAMARGASDDAARWYAGAADAGGADVSAAARYDEARALLEAGDADAAIARLDSLLRSRGASEDLRQRAAVARAIALGRAGRHHEAVRAMSRIDLDSLDPATRRTLVFERSAALRASGDNEAARRDLQTIITSGAERDDLTSHALLEAAAIDMEAGRHDTAARTLDTLLADAGPSRTPLVESARYRRGVCARELGDPDGVVRALAGFHTDFPDSDLAPSADLLCADALLGLGQQARAIEHLQRAAADTVAPDVRVPALLRLGESLAETQQWDASRRAFEGLLAAAPDHDQWFRARFGIGRALENAGNHQGAIEAYRDVVDRHEGETAARAQFQIGECLFAMEDHEAAIRELMRVEILYAYPEWSAAALYEAGRCFEALNKQGEARAQYRRVVDEFASTAWRDAAAERLARLGGVGLPGRRSD